MNNKPKSKSNLWFLFVVIVLAAMLVTFVVIGAVMALLFALDVIPAQQQFAPLPFMMLIIVSIVIGTGISLIVGRSILQPIGRLSDALDTVAKGDFSIRLDEKTKVREISRMYENFNAMTRELSGIETLRSDFIANVSHEFKTPLTAIEGYAALLRNRELTEKQRKDYLDKIAGNARKLSELTGNILWLSKLENQSVIPNKKYYRLDEQIRKTVLSLENEWSVKHLDFDIALPKTDFFGNEGLLYHVWFNLIGNAIKFSHENQTVKISMEEADGEVVVVIADSGCGMEEEAQRHIFEKFYQADKSHAKEGNGLGLTLVKRIVDLCNGHIAVESQLKKGSVFIVRLPTK
ncbi:MAG: two-component sensor histidine kinase [Oscillospiraceae bacterium]|jgi:integral membrane sensor signal transduction histidine kinase|nr:MAG: two-component sensor histidine kinase [Oscillospiraceae bacterium]